MSAPPGARAARTSVSVALAGFAYAALVSLAPRLLRDPDVYFHPAVGDWILAHGEVPARDTFSHSLSGAAWSAHEWLAEIVFALAHAAGGWTLVVALTAAMTALAAYIVAQYLGRHLPTRHVVLFVALMLMLVAIHLNARPHALVLPCFAAFLVELVTAREHRRSPRTRFALLVLLWANMHGSVVLAAVLTAAFAVDAVVSAHDAGARRVALRAWGGFLALVLVASSLTPQGPAALWLAWRMEADPAALALIDEWRPPDLSSAHPLWLCFFVFGAGALLFRPRVPWMRVLLLLAFVVAALRRVRYAEILGVAAPVLLAMPLGVALATRLAPAPTSRASTSRVRATVCLAILASAALTLGVARLGLARPAPTITPERALAAARTAGVTGPVLNAQAFGGYLIARGVPTFVDGRIDLYGGAFLTSYVEAVAGGDPTTLRQLLARYAITWTLLSPASPTVRVLDEAPDWRRLHADDVAVVHVRGERAARPSAH